MLDMSSHSTSGDTSTTKDLYSVIGDLSSDTGTLHLQQSDRSSEVLSLLSVRHVAHLVGYRTHLVSHKLGTKKRTRLTDVLELSLRRLEFGEHAGELGSNNRLRARG